MTTELAGQVKSVAAASSDSTTLTLQNGIEIAFGDSKDIRDKERVCLQLMKEHEGKISYINVRVVNKPVWRFRLTPSRKLVVLQCSRPIV